MKKNSRRKKNEEKKRRFDAIRDLMSTFSMATIAVVATVILIPSSPKADIIKSIALSNEIVYQVNVTDADNALDLSTLYVVVENQIDYQEKPINLGNNSGYFEQLDHDTEYRLSVYGNKGFGQERLDTLMITTKSKIGGTILSVTQDEALIDAGYMVDLSIFDPNSTYSSINLYYGYSFGNESEIVYDSFPLTASSTNIELGNVHFNFESLHVYLEANTFEGVALLDEIWVTPQFELDASVTHHYVTDEEIGFYVYSYDQIGIINYDMNVYKNNFLIQTRNIETGIHEFEDSMLVIDGLLPSTTYTFECIATYTNPQTLRVEQLTVYERELDTLDSYTYSYTKEIIGETLEITVILNDPSNQFTNVIYELTDTTGAHAMHLDDGMYSFEENGTEKSVTFTVFLPSIESYSITATLMNTNEFLNRQKIDILIVE